MIELEYITAQDIDKKIKIRKDIGFHYEENGIYKTTRVNFIENFGTLENYMRTGSELTTLDNFSEESQEIMKYDDYEGKFVYKIILENGKVISHYYTLAEIKKEEILLIPTKIPLENKFTVDPRKIISTSWYYLKSNDDTEYIQTKNIKQKIGKKII